jgi:hypothetical protein
MISIALAVGLIFSIQPIPSFAVEFDNADDITYSLKSGKSLTFDEDDFDEVCVDLTDEDLDYVKFKLPDEDEGILYYNYDEDEDENAEVSSSKKYYYDRSAYLSRITFVPDKDYSGTVSIRYTGYNEDGESYSGRVKITVKGSSSSSDTISYSISYDKDYIQFNKKDFFNYCDKVQSEDLDYVKFTLPDKKSGILYYDYSADDDDNTKVSESKKYYYDSSPYLSRVYFLPDEDFSGTATIRYTGYDVEGDSYNGKVKITVGDRDDDSDSSSDIISYKIDSNKDTVTFDEDDFIDLCDDLKDQDLDYIKFSIPSSSKGILYYNYKNGQYSSVVTSSKKYYVDSSPYLSDVTFVPDSKFSGTAIISFEGWDVKEKSFQGEVSISVGGSSSSVKAITYTGKSGAGVFMKDSDFNSVCRELTDNQLNYVYFSLPSDTLGTLYYGYTQDGNYSAKVRSDTKYYYDGSPYLLNVSFVPARGFNGMASITYTGYDITGVSYTGVIQISSSDASQTPIDTSTLVSSKYFNDVDTSYSWAVPYIDNLYESSIISGSSSGSSKFYSPAAQVTRGDFMLILYRAMKLKTSSTASKFADVPSGSYYYDAIMTAKALGIAQGSDNYFYPNSPITREDAMVFVLRAVNITGKTIPSGDISSLSSYYDNGTISEYSRSAVAALVKAGIITGSDDNKIYPQGSLTRAQIAAIIYRVINM